MFFVFNSKANNRIDWVNIGILILLFGSVLVLLSPAHNYSVTDDWAYAHSVQDMVRLNYSPSEWSMATALSHVAWGAIFVWLFGFSFTVLTVSNLVLSGLGIILFYLLLRQLDVVPAYALLGAAVLFLNPMYIYLSYSFMTEVPFVTYSTAALLCYVIGIKRKNQPRSHSWLIAGSVFVSLAYLVRQLGAILIVAVLIYLLWEGMRPIPIGRILAAILLPCVVIVVYTAWENTFQLPVLAYIQASYRAIAFNNLSGWLQDRLVQLAGGSFLLGLMLLPLLSLQPARSRLLRVVYIVVPFGLILILDSIGFKETGSWAWHNFGNIVDNTGFLMQNYDTAPLFNGAIWFLLTIVSAVAVSIFIAAAGSRLATWRPLLVSSNAHLPEQPLQNTDSQNGQEADTGPTNKSTNTLLVKARAFRLSPPQPRALIILSGLITFVVTVGLSYVTTDRYWLPIFPALIVIALTGTGSSKKDVAPVAANERPSFLRWALLGVMALVTLIGQQDYMAHATARWQAGEQLIAQGIPPDNIYMGIEWSGWYLSDEGVQYFRQHGSTANYIDFNPAEAVIDPIFLASDLPVNGYSVVRSIAYQSFLRGGQGYVLVLERNSAK